MSEPIPESIPTSADPRSRRPLKRMRGSDHTHTHTHLHNSAVAAQADVVSELFCDPERAVGIPSLGAVAEDKRLSRVAAPPEVVANVSGSSAGAGSGEFHVYKAGRRREYERLRVMDEEATREEEDEKWAREEKERRERDEERTRRNREKRGKKKQGNKDNKDKAKIVVRREDKGLPRNGNGNADKGVGRDHETTEENTKDKDEGNGSKKALRMNRRDFDADREDVVVDTGKRAETNGSSHRQDEPGIVIHDED